MKHKYRLLLFFLFVFSFGVGQEKILCGLTRLVVIPQDSNPPSVTQNGDGTITLTHNDQTLTAIFAKYVIYDFVKTSTYNNKDYYKITFQSMDFVKEIAETVSSEIFSMNIFLNTTAL